MAGLDGEPVDATSAPDSTPDSTTSPTTSPAANPLPGTGAGLSWAPVLAAAALVTSPAIWHALQGSTPASVALTRFLVALALCRVALGLLAMCVGPAPDPDSSALASQSPAG